MQMLKASSKAFATKAQLHFGDRAFLNMVEQSPLFLTAMWTHAVFVSPGTRTTI
jgi:hypothetical protein